MTDFKSLLPLEDQTLIKTAFEAWIEHSKNKKKSIINIIKAYQFRYKMLFQKVIKSLKNEPSHYYKLMKFNQFKRAIEYSIADLMHSSQIVKTFRQRRNLKILIKIHRQRKHRKHEVDIRVRYNSLKLKQKIFQLLKQSTLLFRLKNQRLNRMILQSKKLFFFRFGEFSKHISQKKHLNKKICEVYEYRLMEVYFKRWQTLKLDNNIIRLTVIIKSIEIRCFKKCLSLIRKQQQKITEGYHLRLLKKGFNGFTDNAINLKISKYYKYKLTQKYYRLWKEELQTQKENQSRIPESTINRVKEIHSKYTKLTWFNRIYKIYQKKTSKTQKDETIREYYKLKTEEIVYRKYFNAFIDHVKVCQAERYYQHLALSRYWKLLKEAITSKKNQKIIMQRSIKFHESRLLAKSMTILMIPVQKSRTAVQWKQLYNKKKCIEKWIQITVSDYLQAKTKAQNFNKINILFKVLIALKLNVDFNRKIMEVLKVRVKAVLKHWAKGHRITSHFQQRQLKIKAMIFRSWKFYIKY